ncbi:hypothetical protein [Brevundimonas subvibrioides]|uniref:WD-40 repeat protein n=1 Tax=Brevundimonas subvibrioides (strain ATCC 15264 / DSM 4735 / LMG 14903 / NBRC 16000 / CB 81) TaxID=633149 RepID=D9QIA8_BRESC|nr:hypothetical protein [Brevundimonas subvibrioides]ADK99410.1 WD-40 repeat protein [Brevundimonas subvibrioides ATCC 15264]
MVRYANPPTFIPAARSDDPLTFVSIDALAVHLLRQRPSRRLEFCPGVCSRSGAEGVPVVNVFAMRPGDALERRREALRRGEPTADPLDEEWLGWTTGERACDPVEVEAALNRMRSAGGLAA